MADSFRVVEARDGTVMVEVDVTIGMRPEELAGFMELQKRLLAVTGVSWVRVDDLPIGLARQAVLKVREQAAAELVEDPARKAHVPLVVRPGRSGMACGWWREDIGDFDTCGTCGFPASVHPSFNQRADG